MMSSLRKRNVQGLPLLVGSPCVTLLRSRLGVQRAKDNLWLKKKRPRTHLDFSAVKAWFPWVCWGGFSFLACLCKRQKKINCAFPRWDPKQCVLQDECRLGLYMESYQFQLLIDTNSIDFAFTRKTIWEELGSGRNAVSCQMFPSGGILLQPSASLPLVRPGWIQWRAFRSRTRLWIYRERPRTHTGTAGPWGSQAWDASLRLRARWLCFCADSLLSACLKSLLATHWTEWQQSNKLLLLYLLLLLLLLYGTGYKTLGFVNAKESLSVNYIHSPCFFEEGLEFLALRFQPPECWDGLIPPDLTRDTFWDFQRRPLYSRDIGRERPSGTIEVNSQDPYGRGRKLIPVTCP